MNDYLYILENNRRVNIYASLKYIPSKNISLCIFYYYKFLCKLFHIIHIFCIFYVNNINE